MSELAWPAVAALAVVLAFVAALFALRRREGRFAGQPAFEAHLAEWRAFTVAVEKQVAHLDEGLKRQEQRVGAVMESRLPHGLRGVVPR